MSPRALPLLLALAIPLAVAASEPVPKYHHPAEMDDAQRAIRYVRSGAAAWGLDPGRLGIINSDRYGAVLSWLRSRKF